MNDSPSDRAPAGLTIDVHTHLLPKTWPDLCQKYGYGGWVQLEHHEPCKARMVRDGKVFREVRDNLWDPERRLEDCDATGVTVQVLSTVPVMFSYWAQPEHAHDLARFLNDNLAETVAAQPDRFVGLGTLPLQDPKRSVTELTRCVRDLGLAGVQIGSHVNTWNLDRAELFDVFAAAEELGAAVFVHPWDMMAADDMRKYWLPWLVGMPAETARAICSLIFGGVLERLPKLRLLFAHGGGAFPYTLGRIEHGFRVRPDLVAIDNDTAPSEYLDRFYVDTLVHDEAAFRFLLARMGAQRLAVGSDYPFPLGEARPGSILDLVSELSEADRARMRWGTALEFLGLSVERFAGVGPAARGPERERP